MGSAGLPIPRGWTSFHLAESLPEASATAPCSPAAFPGAPRPPRV